MRNTGTIWRFCGTLTAAIFLVTLPTLAQEGGESVTESPAGTAFRWVNFALVAALLVYAIWKWGAPAFRHRADEISQKIAEGTRAREAAEAQRKEIQAKLDGLEAEVVKMRADGKREAAAEAQRLRDAAKEEAQKIETNTQAEIAAATRAMQMKLKSLTARKAVAQAEALLSKEITPASDGRLVQAFVKDVERSAN